MKVAVFGLGYVGTVTAAILASHDHDVIGVDVDALKVASITRGQSPVVEPGLDDVVANAVGSGRLRACQSAQDALEGAQASIVCVGTPTSHSGGTDLSFLIQVSQQIAQGLRASETYSPRNHAVIIRSTVAPGTLGSEIEPVFRDALRSSNVTVGLGMCPEFLREGTAISDFYDAPFTVIGTSDPFVESVVRELFSFVASPVRVVPIEVAEGVKIAANAFHATKISFANEIGRLFRSQGVDGRAVMDLLCQDSKLNISAAYLKPGFAFGGSCLPKDLRSLLHVARVNSLDLPLLSGALATNAHCVADLVSRVLASDAHRIAILGLSFKSDSDDLRESPFVDIAETLLGKGFEVRIFDPIVDSATLVGSNRRYIDSKLPHLSALLTEEPSDALLGADLALVSSPHDSVTRALLAYPPRITIDLSGKLGAEVESMPGYQGVAW